MGVGGGGGRVSLEFDHSEGKLGVEWRKTWSDWTVAPPPQKLGTN